MTKAQEKAQRDKALADCKLYMANGWDLTEETPEAFILKRNTQSAGWHLVIFLLVGWFTFLIPNLVYYLLSKKTKVIMK